MIYGFRSAWPWRSPLFAPLLRREILFAAVPGVATSNFVRSLRNAWRDCFPSPSRCDGDGPTRRRAGLSSTIAPGIVAPRWNVISDALVQDLARVASAARMPTVKSSSARRSPSGWFGGGVREPWRVGASSECCPDGDAPIVFIVDNPAPKVPEDDHVDHS